MAASSECESVCPQDDVLQLDDAYLGGRGHPVYLELTAATGFTREAIE